MKARPISRQESDSTISSDTNTVSKASSTVTSGGRCWSWMRCGCRRNTPKEKTSPVASVAIPTLPIATRGTLLKLTDRDLSHVVKTFGGTSDDDEDSNSDISELTEGPTTPPAVNPEEGPESSTVNSEIESDDGDTSTAPSAASISSDPTINAEGIQIYETLHVDSPEEKNERPKKAIEPFHSGLDHSPSSNRNSEGKRVRFEDEVSGPSAVQSTPRKKKKAQELVVTIGPLERMALRSGKLK